MRIKVTSEDANFTIRFPTILCFNAIGAAIVSKSMNIGIGRAKIGITQKIPYSTMRKIFKEIRKSRNLLEGQPILSVDSADGGKVEIWI